MKKSKAEVFSYNRKSSEDSKKQVESIDRQIAITKERAGRDGVTIQDANILREEKSASKPGRPVFNWLMKQVAKNDHTTIYVWQFNRLARNSLDEGMVRHYLETGKLTIVMPDKVFDRTTNSIVTAVDGGQSTQYSRDLGRMVRDANFSRANKGIYPGPALPGYTMKGPKGRMTHTPDGRRFNQLQRAFRRVLRGMEPMESLRMLNAEGFLTRKHRKLGGKPLADSTWYELLRNPFYGGRFLYRDKWYKGKHKPMITEVEYWKIQELLDERGRPRPQLPADDSYLGMFKCGECESAITRDRKERVYCTSCKKKYSTLHRDSCPHCGLPKSKVEKKHHRSYQYLRCTKQKKDPVTGQHIRCGQSYLPLSNFEQQITERLEQIEIPQEFIDWAIESLAEQNDEEVQTQEEILTSLQVAYSEAQKRRNRLQELYLKGGYEHEGGEEEFDQKSRKEDALLHELKQKIDRFDTASGEWRDKTEQLYDFAKNARDWFIHGDRRTRMQILYSLGANGVIRDKTTTLELHAPYATIKKALGEIRQKFPRVEPKNIAKLCADKRKQPLVAAVKSSWLSIKDDYRTLVKHKLGRDISATGGYAKTNTAAITTA